MPEQSSVYLKALMDSGFSYLWFIFMAIWGGTSAYIIRIKKMKMAFSLVELVGEWAISGFSGVVTASACQSYKLDFYITAALVGISGHMGGRGILLLEHYGRKWINKRLGFNERRDLKDD